MGQNMAMGDVIEQNRNTVRPREIPSQIDGLAEQHMRSELLGIDRGTVVEAASVVERKSERRIDGKIVPEPEFPGDAVQSPPTCPAPARFGLRWQGSDGRGIREPAVGPSL